MSVDTIAGTQRGVLGGVVSSAQGHLPLQRVSLEAEAGGTLYNLRLRQTFVNPTSRTLELMYLFPLPADCWLERFEATVGGRRLQGRLSARGQARAQYGQALKEGRFAALLERERRELFTLTLGTVAAGESIEIEMFLCGELERRRQQLVFRFPALAAPRDLPGQAGGGPASGRGTMPDTDQIPDASRLSPPRWTAPEYPPLEVSVAADLRGLGAVGASAPPGFLVESPTPDTFRLLLRQGRLQGDLVLRFELQEAAQRTYGVHSQDYWLAELWPPPGRPKPHLRDIIFLLEAGSEQELSLVKEAVAQVLADLNHHDRIGVMAFTPAAFAWRSQLCNAEVANLSHLQGWLKNVRLDRAQNFGPSVGWALSWFANDRPAHLVYLGTGLQGNEDTILGFIRQGRFRFHSVAVGSGSNYGFLKALATVGRGSCHLLDNATELQNVSQDLTQALAGPVLSQLQVSYQGQRVAGPAELLPARSATFSGRGAATQVTVEGVDVLGQAVRLGLQLMPVAQAGPVRRAWAQRRYWQLELEGSHEAASFALAEGILCRHTAMVLEDSEQRTTVAQGILWQPALPQSGVVRAAAAAPRGLKKAEQPARRPGLMAKAGGALRKGLLGLSKSKPTLGGPGQPPGKPTLLRRSRGGPAADQPAALGGDPGAGGSVPESGGGAAPPLSGSAAPPASAGTAPPGASAAPPPASAPPPLESRPTTGDLFGRPAEPPPRRSLFRRPAEPVGESEELFPADDGGGEGLFGDAAGSGQFESLFDDAPAGSLFEAAQETAGQDLFSAPSGGDLFAEVEPDFGFEEVDSAADLFGGEPVPELEQVALFDQGPPALETSGLFDADADAVGAQPAPQAWLDLELPEEVAAELPAEPEPGALLEKTTGERSSQGEMLRQGWLGADPEPEEEDISPLLYAKSSAMPKSRRQESHWLTEISPADWARLAARFSDEELALALASLPEPVRERLLVLLGPERARAVRALLEWAQRRSPEESYQVSIRLYEAFSSG